jgi:L-ascorbate metabolism protein UlaG (beta-lactamase superfamily)
MQTPGGKRILIDPWTLGNPACPDAYKPIESLGEIDFVLITHLHNDHVGDAVEILMANPKAYAVCVPEVHAWLASKGVTAVHEMNIGGTLALSEGLSVSMTLAIHTSSFTELDGTVVQGGQPVGYAIHLENGVTVYDAGDTAVFSDMSIIRELYHPQVAILPIGDHYTMGPKAAALAAGLLGVSVVIPIHYGTFPVLTGTPNALSEYLKQAEAGAPDVQVIPIAPGETVG